MISLAEAALRYAELGYRVFPCVPGTKSPLSKHGCLDATADVTQLETWWRERPNANIGLATDGLLVVDVDAGENPWLADDAERAIELAAAPVSLTANGGRHYIFRQPDGKHWRGTAGQIAPDVDTRADGGYIVVPPSALEGDRRYDWAPSAELDVPIDRLPIPPPWLIDQLDQRATSRPAGDRSAGEQDANPIPSGQRNDTLARLAGAMRRVGMSRDEILAALRRVNSNRCQPPLPESEVERITASVGRYDPDQAAVAYVENHWEQFHADGRDGPLRFTGITSRELDQGQYELAYLIDGLLVRGQPGVLAGPKKTLKTNISIDLALSLSNAGLFLNRFPITQPARVGLMSAESGAATIQETARRIAQSKGQPLVKFDNAFWCFEVPQLGVVTHVVALRRFIAEYALEVLILDPTYLMMLGLGDDAANLFKVGELLKCLGDLAQETGCTPILCHHLKKNVAEPYEPAELENIAWAGFQEFVRQWLLLNRRVKYDPDRGGHHELWLSVGGSAGHSGLWGLNVDEGTRQDAGGRRWDVDVLTAAEAYAERESFEVAVDADRKQRQQDSREAKQREAVVAALRMFPAGETPRVIRDLAGLGATTVSRQLSLLRQQGLVEECRIKKNTRDECGVRLR